MTQWNLNAFCNVLMLPFVCHFYQICLQRLKICHDAIYHDVLVSVIHLQVPPCIYNYMWDSFWTSQQEQYLLFHWSLKFSILPFLNIRFSKHPYELVGNICPKVWEHKNTRYFTVSILLSFDVCTFDEELGIQIHHTIQFIVELQYIN